MPACSSSTAPAVAACSSPSRATVACSAPGATCRALRCRYARGLAPEGTVQPGGGPSGEPHDKEPAMHAFRRFLLRNRGLLLFLFGMLVFRSALADWNTVPTGSMQPTIRIGDRIVVDRMAYDLRLPFTHVALLRRNDPQRGDIVIIDSAATGERLVKRVIGLPGDTIALRGNVLYINGHAAHYHAVRVAGIAADKAHPAGYAVESLGGPGHLVRLARY